MREIYVKAFPYGCGFGYGSIYGFGFGDRYGYGNGQIEGFATQNGNGMGSGYGRGYSDGGNNFGDYPTELIQYWRERF